MKEEELKLLENEFCLGCARSCDLLHPNCERGLVKMQEYWRNIITTDKISGMNPTCKGMSLCESFDY